MTTRTDAQQILRALVGNDDADFHEGQFEAISALVDDQSRALVVQRTGWGKSAVYFVATLLLRRRGAGPTILVSPLLALMRDQIAAASRAGVRAVAINSTNPHEWAEIQRALGNDEVDVLLTPAIAHRPPPVGALDGRGTVAASRAALPMIAYAALWNLAGNPAASLPCGLADDGLPLAVQLVGRTDDETTLLSLSAQLEAARPWPLVAPGTAR